MRQVELQQTLSQWHKGQQATVEEKQKQHTSAHSEAVRHGAVHCAAFLHDPGVHRGPDSDLLPVVVFHQVCYLFYQLVVILFDLNADRHLRELPEQVLQQSELPVFTAAVATCIKCDLQSLLIQRQIL